MWKQASVLLKKKGPKSAEASLIHNQLSTEADVNCCVHDLSFVLAFVVVFVGVVLLLLLLLRRYDGTYAEPCCSLFIVWQKPFPCCCDFVFRCLQFFKQSHCVLFLHTLIQQTLWCQSSINERKSDHSYTFFLYFLQVEYRFILKLNFQNCISWIANLYFYVFFLYHCLFFVFLMKIQYWLFVKFNLLFKRFVTAITPFWVENCSWNVFYFL